MHDVRYGFCQCGCGQKTAVSTRNDRSTGRVKGEPIRFVHGHNERGARRTNGPDYVVEPDGGCWLWQRTLDHNGYGRAYDGTKMAHAHRVFYERYVGPIPAGLTIDHLCRVPRCVNPAHLEAVTNAENCRRGSQTKLTVEQVSKIKAVLRTGARSWNQLARDYGVSRSAIGGIARGRRWKDVA